MMVVVVKHCHEMLHHQEPVVLEGFRTTCAWKCEIGVVEAETLALELRCRRAVMKPFAMVKDEGTGREVRSDI